jgi:beta-phosphoglucomutase
MSVKGLIFDLDGVLVDTAKYHFMAWKRLAKEHGIDLNDGYAEPLKGISRKDALDILLDLTGISMSGVEKLRALDKKNSWYLEYIMGIDEDAVFEGVLEFLDLVKSLGYKTAIGSTSDNSSLILECTGLTRFFDVIIDGYKVRKPKPDPEVYLVGAKELQLDPSECVVFEDAVAGVNSAKTARMKVIGVSRTGRLEGADRVITTFAGLDEKILDF